MLRLPQRRASGIEFPGLAAPEQQKAGFMAKYGKAATLILATFPVLAMAQAPQVRPAPQQRPPAAPAASAAAVKPSPKPAVPPDSKRFVTNENFFHASPKPQPNSSAPADASQPGAANNAARPAAVRPASAPVISRPVMPVPLQPTAVGSAPQIHAPQSGLVQPVILTSAPAPASPTNESRAAVDYVSGRLTVVADNATLGSVLKLIAGKTGAVVDLAPELQNEPVIARLGPDSVREVLTGLLNSPRIDYIVFGTGDEPGSLHRIVVRTRNSFGRVAMADVRPPKPQPAVAEEEERLDANGHLAPRETSADALLTPEQRMEKWRKIREEMRQAEIKKQAEDREKEQTQPPDPPAIQNAPEPENPPQQQDNPPLP